MRFVLMLVAIGFASIAFTVFSMTADRMGQSEGFLLGVSASITFGIAVWATVRWWRSR